MVDAALTTPAPGFAVIYGISRNTRGWWDLAPGRALGFDPLDNAEDWADRVESRPEDAMENALVGGHYLAESMRRPALDRS
jgi:uronate dehydrogenase